MTRTVKIPEELAEALAQIAHDLGETEEQFVTRALAARLEALRDNPSLTRHITGLDRLSALSWWLNRAKPGDDTEQ